MEEFKNALEAGDYDQIAEAFRTGRFASTSRRIGPNPGEILLNHAIDKNLPQAVAFLLQRGARAETYPRDCVGLGFGRHPIAKCRSIEVFELLNQAGWPFKTHCPYDYFSEYRNSADYAISEALDSKEVVDWLLDNGVQLNFPHIELRRRDCPERERDDTLGILYQAAGRETWNCSTIQCSEVETLRNALRYIV